MRELPDKPDLNQLRRQARELQRAAARGEVAASEKIRAISPRVTLWSAQLALAREYGFRSWARLKAEVERRAVRSPGRPETHHVIQEVASLAELARAFDVIAGQMSQSVTHDERRFHDLAQRFPEDHALMLVVLDQSRIVGGALAFRREGGLGVTLRIIGLEPSARGLGLGRRLTEAVELAAIRIGASGINLGGASAEIKGFYNHLGYGGRGTMMSKALPMPGRVLEARLRRLKGAAGDLFPGDRPTTGHGAAC